MEEGRIRVTVQEVILSGDLIEALLRLQMHELSGSRLRRHVGYPVHRPELLPSEVKLAVQQRSTTPRQHQLIPSDYEMVSAQHQ